MFGNKRKICERSYDAGYVDGAANERERIIEMMDNMIDSSMEIFTSCLRAARDDLKNHKPN